MDNIKCFEAYKVFMAGRYIGDDYWYEKGADCACFSFETSGRNEDFRMTTAELEELLDYVEGEIAEFYVGDDGGLSDIFRKTDPLGGSDLWPEAKAYHKDLISARKKLHSIGELMGRKMTEFGPDFQT